MSHTIRPTVRTTPSATTGAAAALSRPAPTSPGGARFGEAMARNASGIATRMSGAPSLDAIAPSTTASGPVGGATAMLGGEDDTLALLSLQRQIGLEQQRYATLSNVMKARHDTAKQVAGNLR